MGFPRQLLADHEKLVFDLKPHWVAIVPPILWTIALLVVLFGGYWAAEQIFEKDPGTAKMVVGAIVTLAWLLLAVVPFLRWQFTRFVLTTDRLITRSGIIAKHSKEIPLERVNDVAFNQTVLERIVGAGDLLIESAGERGQNRIGNVRKPEQVQLMIYKEIEENNLRMARAEGGGTAPRPDVESSVTEQLEALGRLKEQGVITEAEFTAKKQELLKRL
jgi:uncharacterized membrane protein YdbT with pleckstrin-like domain